MSLTLYNSKYYSDEKFIVIRNKSNALTEDYHMHDFIELNYTIKGVCNHKIDDKDYLSKKGDLLFINYNTKHYFTTENLEYVNILIKPDFVSSSLSGIENAFSLLTLNDFSEFSASINEENCFIHFDDDEQKNVEALIEIILREQEKSGQGQALILHSALNILLTMIFRKMALPIADKFKIDQSLLTYIKDNCTSPLKMDAVAQKCFYSPSYFSRTFKATTGYSFSQYLQKCRIDKACRLLLETDLKIEDIISQSGFSDRTQFFKKFVEQTGITPLQYRAKNKKH